MNRAEVLLMLAAYAATPLNSQLFDVTSIHQSTDASQDETAFARPGQMIARNVTLKTLVRVAYRVSTLQISGGPGWLTETRFDLTAKTSTGADTLKDMAPMIQAMLAERFSLQVHTESRELSASVLMLAKKGRRIPESGEGDGILHMTKRRLEGRRVTMDSVARALSDVTRTLVVDQTEFTGFLDVKLEWLPDGEQPADDSPPGLITALADFGLTLRRQKTAVPVIVIDAASKPSAN